MEVCSNRGKPADHASRGLTAKELLTSNWFTGPKFLWDKEMSVSEEHVPELLLGDPEVKPCCTLKTDCIKNLSLIDLLLKSLLSVGPWNRAV